MSEKYSAQWIRDQVGDRAWLPLRDCSLCGVDIGYVVQPDDVSFRSACGCSWSPDRPSDFEDIAATLAMQSSDEIRDRIMTRLLSA